MRRSLIVGNWKMNGSLAVNADLLSELTHFLAANENKIDVAVCAPFVYLSQAVGLCQNQALAIGAQDVSTHVEGAYTGEVSATMLSDLGCGYVIVGHSERREYHHESNLLVAQKTLAAQRAGLIPIVCVGETLAGRESGETLDVIRQQLLAVRNVVGDEGLRDCVIAYEPVWAIGTGLTATPEEAQDVHAFIRQQLGDEASKTQILYGGSVKPSNAQGLFSQADIDGALVGGAALNAKDFFKIVSAAK